MGIAGLTTPSPLSPRLAKIGRKYTLFAFTIVFVVGAVSDSQFSVPSDVDAECIRFSQQSLMVPVDWGRSMPVVLYQVWALALSPLLHLHLCQNVHRRKFGGGSRGASRLWSARTFTFVSSLWLIAVLGCNWSHDFLFHQL